MPGRRLQSIPSRCRDFEEAPISAATTLRESQCDHSPRLGCKIRFARQESRPRARVARLFLGRFDVAALWAPTTPRLEQVPGRVTACRAASVHRRRTMESHRPEDSSTNYGAKYSPQGHDPIGATLKRSTRKPQAKLRPIETVQPRPGRHRRWPRRENQDRAGLHVYVPPCWGNPTQTTPRRHGIHDN